MTRLLLASDLADRDLGAAARELAGWLDRTEITVDLVSGVPADAGSADVVAVLVDRPLGEEQADGLLALARPLVLLGPAAHVLRWTAVADAAGLGIGDRTPVHEVRVRPGPQAGEVAARLAGDVLLTDRVTLVDKAADDVEVLLTANVHLVDHPVATLRPGSQPIAAVTLGSTAACLRDPAFARLVHRVVRRCLGVRDRSPVRVGMLGYGAIGAEHSAAFSAVAGLELTAVCDRSPVRVAAARAAVPDLREVRSGAALLDDDDVDLVVVSTPPDSHADWAVRALARGKHVVVEKPFCLGVREADDVMAAASAAERVVVVYQNRRWDADYLALRDVVRSGEIGELFHLESFVGGFAHPCNYWHSHEAVSGGALYDWGAHYLDWTLGLFPQQVEWVSCTSHKRVWHDVTNADHTRLLLHFVDGVEAEFTHSDVAATLKPKWYALGTAGAVRGDWRTAAVIGRNAVGNLVEDRLAESEAPAEMTVLLPDGSGGISERRLAARAPLAYPFHRELADLLVASEPMSVSAEQSRRGVAVMQAATESARAGGRPVAPQA